MSREIVERVEQEEALGLAVLPEELQVVVQAAPDRYRLSLLRGVYAYKEKLNGSEYERAFQLGYLLGSLGAGFDCEFFTYKQYKALSDCLRELRTGHE